MSAILAGLRLSGRTWCYADLDAAAGFAVAPADAIVVHAVIHGTARLACAGGARMELAAGEMVAVLSGEAHAVRAAAGASAAPFDFLRSGTEVDVPPAIVFGENGRIATRVLSGRLAVSWPAEGSRGALPTILPLAPGAGSLIGPDGLPWAGIGPGSATLLTRLAETLLVAALRGDPRCRGFFAHELADPVAEAVRLIGGSPSVPWTVESLARAVGMGRSNFAAQFTRQMGKAPMEVVAEHRMAAAAALLAEGRLKLAEIAELSGYGSEAAFSRRFTRHFGITPSRHREIARREREHMPADPARFRLLLGRAPAHVLPQMVGDREDAPKAAAEPVRRRGVMLRQPRG